jgi:hypothetical protein
MLVQTAEHSGTMTNDEDFSNQENVKMTESPFLVRVTSIKL